MTYTERRDYFTLVLDLITTLPGEAPADGATDVWEDLVVFLQQRLAERKVELAAASLTTPLGTWVFRQGGGVRSARFVDQCGD